MDSPDVYARAARFLETGVGLVWQLTGQERRNACAAGYRALWQRGTGYPSTAFHAAVDPRLATFVADTLDAEVGQPGSLAGCVTEQAARRTGLAPGTPVSLGSGETIATIAARMRGSGAELFTPDPEARRTYERLYRRHQELRDRFGRGDATMRELRALRRAVLRP